MSVKDRKGKEGWLERCGGGVWKEVTRAERGGSVPFLVLTIYTIMTCSIYKKKTSFSLEQNESLKTHLIGYTSKGLLYMAIRGRKNVGRDGKLKKK